MDKQEMTGILGKAMAIVQALEEGGEATAAEIAEQVKEPVSSTYRLLKHLQELDWIDVGSARGQYRLGLFFIRIGGLVADLMDVRERAHPYMQALREQTHLTTYLSVRRGTRSVCIERLTGRSIHYLEYRVGDMLPLNIGGAPRTLLAFLPAEERDAAVRFLEQEDNARPGPTGKELIQELETIRERGWSCSISDVTAGVAAIGAPVFNHRGEVLAAVSTAGLEEQVLRDDDLIGHVVECADKISRSMGLEKGQIP